MKTNLFALFLIFSLLSKVAIAADPIVLLNLENEDEYGPFELVHGEVIELEEGEYKVLTEEESEARKALISRLKTTIIETVNFRGANFDTVMRFARTASSEPINIIICWESLKKRMSLPSNFTTFLLMISSII